MAKLLSWVGIAALALLSAWPLREGFISGEIVGGGPDVASTLWGMWWFQQTWLLFGGFSDLPNFPYGMNGMVLCPSSALTWALAEPLAGVGRAAAIAAWLQVFGLVAGCMVLAGQAGCGRGATWIAGLSPLVARSLFFGIGEGSLVSVAAIPLPFGLAALLAACRPDGTWRSGVAASFCMAWCAMENPYLAPVLPAACVLMAFFRDRRMKPPWDFGKWRRRLLASCILGSVGILFVASAFGGAANPDYPIEVSGQSLMLAGLQWSVTDMPWSRMAPFEAFIPIPPRWTVNDISAREAGGGNYLGVSVLLLALYGAVRSRQARWWLLFSLVGVSLAFGSTQYGAAGPFLGLNAIMDSVARPLTQPTRYLSLTLVGLSVSAALGAHALHRFRWTLPVAAAALLADAVFVGGLSLKPPNTPLPVLTCTETYEGPILLWPWDAMDIDMSRSLLYQIVHGQPAAHTGIASWGLGGGRFINELRGSGFRDESTRLNKRKLYEMGYRWVFTEKNTSELLIRQTLRPVEDCGGLVVYALSPS
jgi:hypothetical protein